MASSLIAGEKKWASARRSGMTVLGKVAVPKPINLPSQKLENHGLDPNVEIVPKGTLSWGTHSSSTPNAWASSSASPNADGSTGSPSYLSGRPTSGSGTRPSTAGSDRAQDPTPNVWGPNSRPSSASGALASNQTALGSLRPRSAETRPGSSQLSRFAENPSSDNPPTWGPNGFSNKLGLIPSNNDGFSLSSGDFPTLGSEKDSPVKNIDSQEHVHNSRPGSSSNRAASGKENTIFSSVGNVKGEPPNTWTRDGSQLTEHAIHPTAEMWQGDIPPGGFPHRPPQHFDAWHGPPMNLPPGGWYRGPPRGPPYGGPLHPSGFPIEPFHFYPSQRPPNSSQQVPPGPAARGHHPKNGELSRPHFPDGYIHPHPHPRMPMNPGFYPAPVHYEGFYGPPMSYCNHNERDMPFIGMPPGPHVYKRHPCENAVDPRPRSPAHGPRGKPSTPERPRSVHSDETRGPYKVILKQPHTWDGKRAEEEWNHGGPSNAPSITKMDEPQVPLQRNEWGLEDDPGTYPVSKKPANETISKILQVPSSPPNASSLIQKIDIINAKARNFDGGAGVAIISMDDQYNQPHISGTAPSRRPSRNAQGRVDHHGKRLNNQDVDGWRRKPLPGESSAGVSVLNLETSSNALVRDCPNNELNIQGKDGDYSTQLVGESDSLAQWAKMREIAKERAERLQKEEEERTREQKAKALAKLEELNQRTHLAEASTQKVEKASSSGTIQQEEEKSRKSTETKTDHIELMSSSSAIVQNREDQIRASNSIMVGENTVVFDRALPKSEVVNSEAACDLYDGSVSKYKQTESKLKSGVNSAKGILGKRVPITQTVQSKSKVANDAANSENITIDAASSGGSSLVTSSNVKTDSSTQHKKKNSWSSKSKHKLDEVAHVSVVPTIVANETNTTRVSTEKCEQDTNLPPSKAVVKHSVKDFEQQSSLSEESSAKGSHQWKPQQPRRMPRNQQGSKRMDGEGEKSHSSETVTWASVRSQNKIEPMDKPGDIDTTNADPSIDTTNAKVEAVVQNNMRTKRADMERYRPKPVAKELAQQERIQQIVAQNTETTLHGDSAIADADNNKQNKPSKARGSWKQRVYIESAPNENFQEADKNLQNPTEQEQPLKSEVVSSKEQNADGWNSNYGPDMSAPVTSVVAKGRVQGRGKRHPYKSNRDTGNSYERDQWPADKTPPEPASAPEVNQIDKNNNALKENPFGGERMPQWQPKMQMHSVHNRRDRPVEGQMDAPSDRNQIDQSLTKPVNVVHQDPKREKRPASYRARPHSPNTGPSNITVEPEIEYVKNNQHFSSGFRNNHSGRGHEPRRDASFHRERQRQSPHFEYQPVGQYDNSKPNNLDGGSSEGSHNVGPKYRERNQGYFRRGGGNFNGRQSGVVHGDACYD